MTEVAIIDNEELAVRARTFVCGLDVSVSYQSVERLLFGRPRTSSPFSHTPTADDVTQDRQFLIVDDRDFGHERALHRNCAGFLLDDVVPKYHAGAPRGSEPSITANAPMRLAQHKIFEHEVKLTGGQGPAVESPDAFSRGTNFGPRTYALCYHMLRIDMH